MYVELRLCGVCRIKAMYSGYAMYVEFLGIPGIPELRLRIKAM
jgi:hypothetical protein